LTSGSKYVLRLVKYAIVPLSEHLLFENTFLGVKRCKKETLKENVIIPIENNIIWSIANHYFSSNVKTFVKNLVLRGKQRKQGRI